MSRSEPLSLVAATQQLASRATQALSKPAEKGHPQLSRVEIPIVAGDPLEWLGAQSGSTRYYWSARDEMQEMAGVGEADVFAPPGPEDIHSLFRKMRSRIPVASRALRYYGGIRFHPGPVKGARWRAFGDYRFVVPRFEVTRQANGCSFACNMKRGSKEENAATLEKVLAALAQLNLGAETQTHPRPIVTARTDLPDREQWRTEVEYALKAIEARKLSKVVLARETLFTTEQTLDAVALLSQLLGHTMHAYAFCFHPARDRAFIGASPERLFKRTNCYLESEALAGTRPRGKTDEVDRALGQDLLKSDKDRREHQFVVEALRAHFDSFCRTVDVEPAPHLLRLMNCQHLHTRFQGVLHEVRDDLDADLIAALHPTPAVGGLPRDAALRWITEREPFDRGIYAAPVGWVGLDGAEFCVALRSGLVRGNELALYNGAGIVRGSDPDEEWQEIETKMQNFLSVLDYAY